MWTNLFKNQRIELHQEEEGEEEEKRSNRIETERERDREREAKRFYFNFCKCLVVSKRSLFSLVLKIFNFCIQSFEWRRSIKSVDYLNSIFIIHHPKRPLFLKGNYKSVSFRFGSISDEIYFWNGNTTVIRVQRKIFFCAFNIQQYRHHTSVII